MHMRNNISVPQSTVFAIPCLEHKSFQIPVTAMGNVAPYPCMWSFFQGATFVRPSTFKDENMKDIFRLSVLAIWGK